MTNRRLLLPAAETAQRQDAWLNAPTIAARFPRTGRFAISMRFRDPSGAAQPSPIRQIYEPSMRAHFEQRCPLRDCSGGGFDLNTSISSMLSNRGRSREAQVSCQGSRGRAGECGLELSYSLTSLDSTS